MRPHRVKTPNEEPKSLIKKNSIKYIFLTNAEKKGVTQKDNFVIHEQEDSITHYKNAIIGPANTWKQINASTIRCLEETCYGIYVTDNYVETKRKRSKNNLSL